MASLSVSHTYAHPPEAVFDAWREPAPGGCRLTLTHDGVPPGYEAQTRHGWGMILKALEGVLED